MKTLRAWIEAVRLRTLPVSVAGVFSAWACNITDINFDTSPAVLCLVFAVLCQTASNFANEYFDYRAGRDRKGRQGPRRGVTEGDISPRAMAAAIVVTLGLAGIVGLAIAFYGGWWLIGAGILIGVGALAYSTGPYPLSTHCLGEVAVFFFFGIIPVCLTYYIQAHTVTTTVLATAASIGFMGANVLIVNNYRDIDEDIAVGKHTLPAFLGRKWALRLYTLNALLAAILLCLAWFSVTSIALPLPVLYFVMSCVLSFKMSKLHGAPLNPYLGRTALLMLLTAITLLIIAAIYKGL